MLLDFAKNIPLPFDYFSTSFAHLSKADKSFFKNIDVLD
jgi:hypothetical protein